jgi:hypothetical protein
MISGKEPKSEVKMIAYPISKSVIKARVDFSAHNQL